MHICISTDTFLFFFVLKKRNIREKKIIWQSDCSNQTINLYKRWLLNYNTFIIREQAKHFDF